MQYYQSPWQGRHWLTDGVKTLLVLTAAVFLAQILSDAVFPFFFSETFSLNRHGFFHGKIWQPISYMFLHADIWHIFFNMLGLFFFGPEVERVAGTRRFVQFYLICGAVGGMGWLLFSKAGENCIGASGAVFGVLGAFAAIFPDKPVTLLLLFVFPITMRARTLAVLLGLFEFFSMLKQADNIAYAAHLAGGVYGYLYGRAYVSGRGRLDIAPRRWWNELAWRWRRRKFKVMPRRDADDEAPDDSDADEEEINRILEKITAYGFDSLTLDERDTLLKFKRWR